MLFYCIFDQRNAALWDFYQKHWNIVISPNIVLVYIVDSCRNGLSICFSSLAAETHAAYDCTDASSDEDQTRRRLNLCVCVCVLWEQEVPSDWSLHYPAHF